MVYSVVDFILLVLISFLLWACAAKQTKASIKVIAFLIVPMYYLTRIISLASTSCFLSLISTVCITSCVLDATTLPAWLGTPFRYLMVSFSYAKIVYLPGRRYGNSYVPS